MDTNHLIDSMFEQIRMSICDPNRVQLQKSIVNQHAVISLMQMYPDNVNVVDGILMLYNQNRNFIRPIRDECIDYILDAIRETFEYDTINEMLAMCHFVRDISSGLVPSMSFMSMWKKKVNNKDKVSRAGRATIPGLRWFCGLGSRCDRECVESDDQSPLSYRGKYLATY
jgi:hypothetical protein